MSDAGREAFIAMIEAKIAEHEAYLRRMIAEVEEQVEFIRGSCAVKRSKGGGDGWDASGPRSVSTQSAITSGEGGGDGAPQG